MRVTRVIREYVEKEIYNKRDEKLKEVKVEYLEQKKKCNEEIEKFMEGIIETTIYPQITVLLRKYGMDIPPLEQCKTYGYGRKCYISYHVCVENETSEGDYRTERANLFAEADEKIKNILIDLELGANKTELKEMLEKVTF